MRDGLRRHAAPLALAALVVIQAGWVLLFGLDNLSRQNDEFLAVLGSRTIADDPLTGLFGTSYGDRGPERLTAVVLWLAQAAPGGTAADLQMGRALIALLGGLTAVPVYALARGLDMPRGAALATAAAAVVTPWATFGITYLNNVPGVLTTTVLVWAMWRALVRPSAGADVVVLVAAVLATAARVSQAAFVLAFVPAVLLVLWRERPAGVGDYIRWLPRRLVARHPVLTGAAVLAMVALTFRGQDGILGGYGSQITGQDLELERLGDQAFEALARLAPATALVLTALGLPWLLREAVRPRRREGGAFAVLVLGLLAVWLYIYYTATLEDRYVAALLPLVVVGGARALWAREIPWPVVLVAGAIAARAVVVAGPETNDFPFAAFIDAGSIFLRRVVVGHLSGPFGDAALTVALAVAVLLAAGALLVRGVRRPAVAVGTLLAVAGWGAVSGTYAMDRFTDLAGRPELSWKTAAFLDEAPEAGDEAIAVLGSRLGDADPRDRVLDANYFNAQARAAFVVPRAAEQPEFCCPPLPAGLTRARPDERTGAVRTTGDPLPRFFAVPTGFQRLRFAGDVVRTSPLGLQLLRRRPGPLRLEVAYREGIGPDGWSREDAPVRLRVFADEERQCLRVLLTIPPNQASIPGPPDAGYSVRVGGLVVERDRLAAGARRELVVPLPGPGAHDVAVRATPARPLADLRSTAMRLDDARLARCG